MTEVLYRRLEQGISPFHVVEGCVRDLQDQGFAELQMDRAWELKENGRYYINHHGSTLVAFAVPDAHLLDAHGSEAKRLRIASVHTDYPCIRIKPAPDLYAGGCHMLNTEIYGGPILNTWMDRPLQVGGRIAVCRKGMAEPKMILFRGRHPIATIPNLAIHLNKDVNKGQELNKQTQMLPVIGTGESDDEKAFSEYLSRELQTKAENILDYELTLSVAEAPMALGLEEEFLSSPRIDNIVSVSAVMEAIMEVRAPRSLVMAVFFDHEEIGSRSKQGAQSALLTDVIEKVYESMGRTLRQAKDAIYGGLMLSVDVAHGLHPNYMDKADLTNRPILNRGFCIKEASSQSYATDCESVGMIQMLARRGGIPVQKFANRSDLPGGRTLGALSAALLPMRTVDVGIPIWAMHSARECMGVRDYGFLVELLQQFISRDPE